MDFASLPNRLISIFRCTKLDNLLQDNLQKKNSLDCTRYALKTEQFDFEKISSICLSQGIPRILTEFYVFSIV